MAGNKYLEWSDVEQGYVEVAATDISTGPSEAGDIVALNANGEIDPTMLPNAEVLSFVAGEAVSAGDMVYIDGSSQVRLADASSSGVPAIGFVKDNALATESVLVYFEGVVAGLAGLTSGAEYFLDDTTPGAITTTAPTGANKIVQSIGTAVSTTQLIFEQDVKVRKRSA